MLFDFKFEFIKMRLFVLKDELLAEESANPKACIRLSMDAELLNDLMEMRLFTKSFPIRL